MAVHIGIQFRFCLLGLALLLIGFPPASVDAAASAAAAPSLDAPVPVGASPAAAAFDPLNVSLLGHLGGQPQAIAMQSSYAYVVTDSEIAVIDIADPASPRRVGYLALSDLGSLVDWQNQSAWPDVVVQGDYLYLPINSVGVVVVDVATPTAPHVVGRYPTPGRGLKRIAAASDTAYVVTTSCPECNDPELRVLDVTDPATPTLAGQYALTPGTAPLITAQGTLVYLASGLVVTILDAANPVSPTLRSQYSFPGNWTDAKGLVADGRYLYIPRTDQTLRVLDMADPGQPVQVANFALATQPNVAVLQSPYLFLGDNARIDILDVHDPDAIQVVGSSTLPHNALAAAGAQVGALTADSLQLLDVTDAVAPIARGALDLMGEVIDVAVAGQMVYAITGAKLYTIDASDPTMPVILGSLATPGATDLELVGSHAFVATGEKLQVIDVSVPGAPIEVGAYPFPDAIASVVKMALVGARLYITYEYDRGFSPDMAVVDISDPTKPAEIGMVDNLRGCFGLQSYALNHVVIARANRLYLTQLCGADVLDIADPLRPALIGYWGAANPPTDYTYAGIAAHDDLIYVGTYASYSPFSAQPVAQVHILDSGPLPITEAGVLDRPHPDKRASGLSGLVLDGDYLYASGAALTVWHLADPVHPTLAGRYDFNALYYGAAVADHTFYSAGSGLSILRFTEPTYVALSGRVTQANGAAPGASITIKTETAQASTGATGAYAFANIVSGTHTLVPSLPGHIFEPAQRTVLAQSDLAGLDFVVLPAATAIGIEPGVATNLAYTDTQGLWTQLDVPTNAVTQTMQLVLTPTVATPFDGYAFAAHAFHLAAVLDGQALPDFAFGGPLGVTIHYSDLDVRAIDEGRLVLWWRTGDAWTNAEETCVPPSEHTRNPAANVIRVGICRTGTYALFGPTQRVYLPCLIHTQ
jgi:hypothetical protein